MSTPIYLDYNATTPVDPRVMATMLPYFTEKFGNAASSAHRYGWEASAAVEKAREQLASLIGAQSPAELTFTSGATEANNLALKGALAASRIKNPHVITQQTEHDSVLGTCHFLERHGVEVTYLPVDAEGRVSSEILRSALTDRTALVSIMTANNEIGTIQDIPALAAVVHAESTALFHTDAVQAAGKLPLDVAISGVDLLSLSAHKLYGPKGVGALYVRKRRPPITLTPLIHGGGQERGLRSGTLAVPLIVGFGAAAEIAQSDLATDAARISALKSRFLTALQTQISGVHINGHPTASLPNTINLSFDDIDASALIALMPGLALSSGSACTSGTLGGSHVIQALGHARSSLRISLGRPTLDRDIDAALSLIVEAVHKHRSFV